MVDLESVTDERFVGETRDKISKAKKLTPDSSAKYLLLFAVICTVHHNIAIVAERNSHLIVICCLFERESFQASEQHALSTAGIAVDLQINRSAITI